MWKFLAAVLALATSIGAAHVEQTPIPRDPKPDFSKMAFLIGTWDCKIASSRRPRPFDVHETVRISPDGYWLVTKTVTPAVPWNRVTITNMDYVTFDPTTNRWIDLSYDDFGAYDVSESPGWNGSTLAWNEIAYPKLHGVVSDGPRTFKKLADDDTVQDAVSREPNGKTFTVRTTCLKDHR